MKIPLSYKNLTLRKFIELKALELSCKTKEEVKAAIITHYTGNSIASIPNDEWKLLILRTELLLQSYDKIKNEKIKEHIWIKGKRFKGITDATKLCNNQYTGIKTLVQNGQGDVNLNKLAGLIFYRHKFNTRAQFSHDDFEEIQELMLDAKVGDIAPTVFFYAKVLERLKPLLKYYSLRSQIEIEEAIEELMKDKTLGEDLKSIMVGTTK